MTIEKIVGLLNQVIMEVEQLKCESKREITYEEDMKMVTLAKQYPIHGHILVSKSESLRNYYSTILMSLFHGGTNTYTTNIRMLYLYRIMAAYDLDINIKECITKSLKVDRKYLEHFFEVLDSESSICFAVDLLAMGMMGFNENQRKDYEAIVNILQLFNFDRHQIIEIVQIAKSIVEQDFLLLLKQMASLETINFKNFLGYYSNNKYTNITNVLNNKTKKMTGHLLIVNAQICDYEEYIELGEYAAEEIHFYHCSFNNIRGFRENTQPVTFENCRFENNYINSQVYMNFWGKGLKERKKFEDNYIFIQGNKMTFRNSEFTNIQTSRSVLDIADGNIENCKFICCRGVDLPCTYMFQIYTGKIMDSLFKECNMETNSNNRQSTEGGIVLLENGILENSRFEDCNSKGDSGYGSYAWYRMQIVRGIKSKINNCYFNECRCSSIDSSDKNVSSYILGLDKSVEENNEFVECFSYHYSFSKRSDSYNVGQI